MDEHNGGNLATGGTSSTLTSACFNGRPLDIGMRQISAWKEGGHEAFLADSRAEQLQTGAVGLVGLVGLAQPDTLCGVFCMTLSPSPFPSPW